MSSILNQLMNYLENTSSKQLKKDWEDLSEWNKVGSSAVSGVQVIVACDCNLRKEESWLEY